MKKYLIIIILFLLVLIGILILNPKKSTNRNKKVDNKTTYLFDNEYYKDLKLDNIKSIDVLKYTEGGLEEENYTDKEFITETYNYWKNTKLGEETNMSCEDNTIIYKFNMDDNSTITIEKECDWVIINDKRYLID